jgi:putative ABC transport system permease protein
MFYNTSVDTGTFAELPGDEICNVVATFDSQADHKSAIKEIDSMEHVRKIQYVDGAKINIEGFDEVAYITADYDGKETRVVYDGRYPEKSGELVLAGPLVSQLNKKVGDSVTVEFGGKKQECEVVGLASGSVGTPTVNVLTEDYKRLNPDWRPFNLYIYLDKGTDAAKIVKDLESRFDKDFMKGVLDFDKMYAEGMASYQTIIEAMGIAMLAITLLVIALVLYFVISSTVIRHKRGLGIQKAIGYTTLQLMNQMATSFAVPVFLGMILGCLSGAFFTNPILTVILKGLGVMKANFTIDPLWVAVFGIAAALFSYLLSLAVTWRIKRISAYALVTE